MKNITKNGPSPTTKGTQAAKEDNKKIITEYDKVAGTVLKNTQHFYGVEIKVDQVLNGQKVATARNISIAAKNKTSFGGCEDINIRLADEGWEVSTSSTGRDYEAMNVFVALCSAATDIIKELNVVKQAK